MHNNRPINRTLLSACLATAIIGVGIGDAFGRNVAEIANLSGPDRQKILIEGAKKEGKLTLYTSLIVNQAVRPIKKGFEKKYPFIALEYIRSNSSKLIQRLLTENRARANKADVVAGSTSAGLKRAQLLQSFNSPEMAAYPKNYIQEERLWVNVRFSYNGIAYNKKLVSEKDAPKSWEDLLNPRWKGKMVWGKSLETGGPLLIAHLRKLWGEDRAAAYFDKMAGQKVTTQAGSIRAILDLVVAGEYQIMVSAALHHVAISQKKGAKIGFSSPDPVIARPSHLQLIKAAPHPHAAMLFIDFLLSKEGQGILRKARYIPAHPKVDPLESMKRIVPRLNGLSERIYDPETVYVMRKKTMAIFKKLSR